MATQLAGRRFSWHKSFIYIQLARLYSLRNHICLFVTYITLCNEQRLSGKGFSAASLNKSAKPSLPPGDPFSLILIFISAH